MLVDLYGYYKRNLRTLNDNQKQKIKKELLAIVAMLDNNKKCDLGVGNSGRRKNCTVI